MLTIREINKVKTMFFQQHCSVTYIARVMKISKGTVYKYLKNYDFNISVSINKRYSKIHDFKDIIISWLEEDRKHHHKQRHTARRVFNRLRDEIEGFDVSYNSTCKYFRELKQQVFQIHNGYLPLSHTAGECQVDLGECSYVESGIKNKGYYFVATFPYSNASYCQLLPAKNTECLLSELKHLFEYIGGVPHTIWFDNDTNLVRVERINTIKKYMTDTFIRFKMHYDFKEIFCNIKQAHEKGAVEAGVRYIRKNLLVPVPCFNCLSDFNKDLLDKSIKLHERLHYLADVPITDLHFDDLNELNPLPSVAFEVCSITKRKLDNMGRLFCDGKTSYFISPLYAYKTVQLKLTKITLFIYTITGELLFSTKRIYDIEAKSVINYPPYLRLLAEKPNAINNFDLSGCYG